MAWWHGQQLVQHASQLHLERFGAGRGCCQPQGDRQLHADECLPCGPFKAGFHGGNEGLGSRGIIIQHNFQQLLQKRKRVNRQVLLSVAAPHALARGKQPAPRCLGNDVMHQLRAQRPNHSAASLLPSLQASACCASAPASPAPRCASPSAHRPAESAACSRRMAAEGASIGRPPRGDLALHCNCATGRLPSAPEASEVAQYRRQVSPLLLPKLLLFEHSPHSILGCQLLCAAARAPHIWSVLHGQNNEQHGAVGCSCSDGMQPSASPAVYCSPLPFAYYSRQVSHFAAPQNCAESS